MNYNNSLVSYLFKVKEIDSSSANSKALLNSIKDTLRNEDSVYKGNLETEVASTEYLIENELERLNAILDLAQENIIELDETIKKRMVELRVRLLECEDLVKQALITDKTLVSETYTALLPLTKEYVTENSNVTIEDGVVLGIGYNELDSNINKVRLDTLNILPEEDCTYSITSTGSNYPIYINFNENYYKPYNQIKISIPSIKQTGILVIKFEEVQTISILDKYGYEINEGFVTNILKLPVELSTKAFSIRFLDNKQRTVKIEDIYFTETIYNTSTIFETTPFIINKELSFISVETCDNYSNKDINIKYEISINGENYEEFRPSRKLKNRAIQSLIKTDKYSNNELIKLVPTEFSNGNYKYYTDSTVVKNSRLKMFSLKLGEDILSLENFIANNRDVLVTEDYSNVEQSEGIPQTLVQGILHINTNGTFNLNVNVPEDFFIQINENTTIQIDKFTYTYDNENLGKIKLKKGMRFLKIPDFLWKETINLSEYSILDVQEDYIEVENNITKEKLKVDNYFNPDLEPFNSLYLQLIKNNCEVYLYEENIYRKYDNDLVEYFYKDNSYPTYLMIENPTKLVDTVQIKATMNSKSGSVCPYISKLLIRGI